MNFEITGPVIPIPTPFTEKQAVDYEALEKYVKWLIDNGIKNVMTTIGTSRFNLLSDHEIKQVNETVAEVCSCRAISIVANPPSGGTLQAIEFAQHAKSIGADFFLAYFPERYYGEENTYNYFKSLSEAVNIDILIHEMPMRNGFGGPQQQYSLALLDKLFQLDNIVGLKEEALDTEYSNSIVEKFSDKAIIIGAGGGMSRYLQFDFERGSKAYLGGIGGFYPQLELDFYRAVTSGDEKKAGEIVNDIELPYFKKVVPMGWHPLLKAAIALKGLMPAFERLPMKTLTQQETETLQSVMAKNGWL